MIEVFDDYNDREELLEDRISELENEVAQLVRERNGLHQNYAELLSSLGHGPEDIKRRFDLIAQGKQPR